MIKKEDREKWNKSGLVTKEDRERLKCNGIPENVPLNLDAETMDKWFGHKQLRC